MIQLQGVTKRCRGHNLVLDGVDLTVAEGDVVVVSGATGAGKSTLLGLVYAATVPDVGVVEVFGRNVAKLRRTSLALLRQRIGVVPEHLGLLPDRSALDNVALALEIRAESLRTMRARAAEALGEVGLGCDVDAPVRALSFGQRQLVALARALVRDPAVLIADEPSAHLDQAGCDTLVSRVCAGTSRGMASLLSSNDPRLLDAAEQHGWRRVELCGGTLRARSRTPAWDGDLAVTADDYYESFELIAEDNVIPFPLAAQAGGLE